MGGVWIFEFAELSTMRKADNERLKAFISQTSDRGRIAHAKFDTTRKRQCVFAGTTNSSEYLRDATGGTRFWPVRIEKTHFPKLKEDLSQLWAEAAAREASGENHELEADMVTAAAIAQDERSVIDPWEETILSHIADENGNLTDCKVAGDTLFNFLGISVKDRSQAYNERLGSIMTRLGFKRKKVRIAKKTPWMYVRGDGGNYIV
jgi:predicted P-loop ATPase